MKHIKIYEAVKIWIKPYLEKGPTEIWDDTTERWNVYFEDLPKTSEWDAEKDKAYEKSYFKLRLHAYRQIKNTI